MQQKRNGALLAASLLSALITLIIYLPAAFNGFVAWDDPQYVYENPGIRSLDLAFIKRAFTEVYFSNWHPLTMISYAVDYSLWGLNPVGYHIENIVIHALNTALVAVLSARLITAVRPLGGPAVFAAAFFPALIFGIHPQHVESVAWISERKDVLSALFFIGSVLLYLRWARDRKPLSYILCLVLFAMSIMSKSMAVTLPAVLLLIDFYPLKRLSGAKAVFRAVIEKLPFFAVSAFASAMALHSQSAIEGIPLDLRIYSAIRAVAFYLEKFFVPVGLAPLYPLPFEIDPLGADYIVSYAVVGGITAIALAAVRYRAFITAWLYFLGTLVPVLGLVQIGAQAAADRYMYLPSLGIVVLLGAGAALIIEKNSRPLMALLAIAAAVSTVGLSAATVRQAAIWKDTVTLWSHEIRLFPDTAYIAYVNRAVALKNAGRHTEALSDLEASIRITPTALALYNRGNLRKKAGDIAGAEEDYRRAISLSPKDAAARFNLALLLEGKGDLAGAIENASVAASLGMGQAAEYRDYLERRVFAAPPPDAQ